ncbi:MAG: hypothetical protein AAGH74_16825 [Pseudomonadota bacterium]
MKFEAESALKLLFDVNEPFLYILILPAAILVTLGRQKTAIFWVFCFVIGYVLYGIHSGSIVVS